MDGDPDQRGGTPSQLPSAARLELADLLRSELRAAYAAALARGATPEDLAELVTERRTVLRSMHRDAAPHDDAEGGFDDPRHPLRIVEQD